MEGRWLPGWFGGLLVRFTGSPSNFFGSGKKSRTIVLIFGTCNSKDCRHLQNDQLLWILFYAHVHDTIPKFISRKPSAVITSGEDKRVMGSPKKHLSMFSSYTCATWTWTSTPELKWVNHTFSIPSWENKREGGERKRGERGFVAQASLELFHLSSGYSVCEE